MKNYKVKMRKFNRVFRRIIRDKQLLGLLLLILVVIITGILVIGLNKMVMILFGFAVIGMLIKAFINRKNPSKKGLFKDKKVTQVIFNGALIFITGCMLLGFAFIGYIAISAPEFNPANLYRKESSTVYNSNGEVIAKLGSQIRNTITFDEMPQVLIDAVIATEDSRFYQHNGVDLPRFLKATAGQLMGNSAAGGGSTISMQVIKQSFTSSVASGIKGIIRKFTDIYMSIFKLEKNYTKEQIIEYYVNGPFLGSNSYGVAEAADTYFGKDVSDLNLSEAALIAGLFQSPTYYDPYLHPDKAEQRRGVVLRLMVRHGYITKEEEDMANSISVESLLSTKKYTNPYQSFIDVVIDEIYDKTGENPYNTPMKIYTTLDIAKQDHLNSVVNGEKYKWINDTVQTGIAITDVQTGAILAISGGRNVTAARGFNRATMTKNQPGSTAKPIFDYGPGVEYNNWSTYTPFIDEEWAYSNGIGIKNWDGRYYGLMTLKRALGLSRNVTALKAFQNVDNSQIYKFVTSLGITPETEDGSVHQAHALGAFNGASPLQMAAAYASFGNGGYYIEPYSVTKIVYLDNNQTKEYKPTKSKVMSDSTAYIITKALIWGVDSGISYGGEVPGYEIAAKTGTTNFDYATAKAYKLPSNATKDYWVVGYSPKVAMGLWYGYDKISSTTYNTVADNTRKSAIYNMILKGIVNDSPRSFTVPRSVSAVRVELGTIPAMLASENTPADQTSVEYFKTGTEPTMVSPRYQPLSNVSNFNVTISGKTASLSWDAAKIPVYFTTEFSDTYFKDGMGDFPSRYVKYRENEFKKLGSFGYDIYVTDQSGTSYLKTTTDTSATIDMNKYSGNITFTVRTAWGADKSSISSGSTYQVSGSDSSINVSLNGDSNMTLDLNAIYDDSNPITITNNGTVVSNPTINRTIKNSNGDTLSSLDTSTPGTYTITYSFNYNGYNYNKTRTIIIKES